MDKADTLLMPYFITDKAEGCSGWATIKADGEVIGCHTTKAAAIKQMVAISLAEKMEPGGERALPQNYRPALANDVPEGRACGNCFFYDDDVVNTEGNKALCRKWNEFVDGGYYCNSWQPDDEDSDDMDDDLDDQFDDDIRAINAKVPAYMRAAARRGLEYVKEGKAGDGLKQQTINEARKMAAGEVSDDKWVRMAAWIARHLGDLDSPEADPNHPNYPSAGVVAHLLWGSGPSKSKARAAMEYSQGVVERIRNEERHLAGKHDQSTHGKGGGAAGMGRIPLDEATVRDMQGGSAAPHIIKKADGTYGFTPEREALHDQLVSEALAGVPRSENPTVVFLGGGAASGKSTAIAGSGIDINEKHVTINPDDVKKKLPEYKQKSPAEAAAFTHEESSYVSKRIQAAAVQGQKDIVVDAVGDTSAANMNKKIDAAKAKGYRTVGTYVTIPTAEAQARAAARGVKEGRVVPPDVVAAGHRGVSNTFPQIMTRFDEVSLFNNEIRGNLRLIGSGKNGTFNVEDEGLWSDFLAKGSE